MNKLLTLLTSIGLGAGLMYFYDPRSGNRRRALVRDQVNSLMGKTDDAIDVAVQDLRNRTRGVLAETMARLSDEPSPDWLVRERVRAEMGRFILNPGAIDVSVDAGKVTLSGPILAEDVDRLIHRVSMVLGVKSVDNQLDVHQEPGDIPALQGRRFGDNRPGENWSPSLRLLSGVGGGLLALYGGLRKGLLGTAMSVTGLGLMARGVTNTNLKGLLGMSSDQGVIKVQKAINIDAPVDRLYEFWSNFENFPRFMKHVRQVKDLGNGRSHWVVAGPAGSQAEWDAIITQQVPNEIIAWESVAGSEVKTSGTVRFHSNPGGGTRLTVQMSYTPPAGALGHVIASLFGKNPKQAMDEDLSRLKTLLEEGKTTVQGREITGQDLAGATSY